MIFKGISSHKYKEADWEQIPEGELWEDGELSSTQVQHKILHHTMQQGDWILVRKVK